MLDKELDLDVLDKFLSEIKKQIKIDPHNLVNECRNQSVLYANAGAVAVKVKSKARRLKDELEVVRSEVESDIREHPSNYGLVKTTEGAIASAILLDKRHKDARTKYRDYEEYADAFSIIQVAMEQRKAMLRDLATLFVHDYYSDQDVIADNKTSGKLTQQAIIDQRKQKLRERMENGDGE